MSQERLTLRIIAKTRCEILIKRAGARFLISLKRPRPVRLFLRRRIGKHVSYRKANSQDILALSRFYAYHKRPDRCNRVAQLREFLRNLGKNGNIFMAIFHGKIVGAAVLICYPDTHLYPGWWLFDLKVHPCFWGAGIGEGLVSMALKNANELGAHSVNLFTSEKNRPALELYRKVGFGQVTAPSLNTLLSQLAKNEGGQKIVLSKSL